jgi:hypothetical protein
MVFFSLLILVFPLSKNYSSKKSGKAAPAVLELLGETTAGETDIENGPLTYAEFSLVDSYNRTFAKKNLCKVTFTCTDRQWLLQLEFDKYFNDCCVSDNSSHLYLAFIIMLQG